MKALCLLIISAIINCSVEYTIVERPAKIDENEFNYNRIPSGVVQSRLPVGFWFQQHPYNLPKPEPQALFELYYLIQVITIYRRQHPRAHRTHLDALVEELQDDDFQQKLRQALQGVKELNVLQAYTDLNLQDYVPFVNDRRQLIPAIHRTLSEIHFGQIEDKDLRWTLERLKDESTALTVKMARKEAEVLQELIESNRKLEKVWTVSDILAAVFGKQDNEDTMKDFEQKYEVVDDGKPVDDGKVEEFWVVFEDDKKEESTTRAVPSSTTIEPFQFIDDNYEQYEAKQEAEQSPEQISEPNEVDVEDVDQEQESEPKGEAESLEQVTDIDREDNVVEEESLEQESTDDLNGEQRIETDGFEFKEENYERSDPEEEDYERTVPEEDDQGFIEEVVAEEELPDTVPEELQTLIISEEAVEVSDPEFSEVDEEQQSMEDSAKSEEQPEPEFTNEETLPVLNGFSEDVVENLQNLDVPEEPVEQPEPEFSEELEEELSNMDATVETAVIPEPVYMEEAEGKLQNLDDSEEPESELTEESVEEIPEPVAAKSSSDSITFPEDPQWVDDSVRPLGSSAATGLDSDPPQIAHDSYEDIKPAPEVDTPVTQSVPLWISKGYNAEYEGRKVVEEDASQLEEVREAEVDANELESRAEPTETVEIDQETLRYIAFEILKVVSLLEDNAGFAGLRDQITSDDVDRLIEQLSVEQFVALIDEQGINRVEMINALELLIEEKNLDNSSEIVAVLEQWKQGEGVQPVEDGYFGESYGKSDNDAESRTLEDDQVLGESELVVATPDEAQEAEQLVDELEGELKGDVELQVEDSDMPDEVAENSKGVQELKSGDLVEHAELLHDSPELLEDAADLSESILQVENFEASFTSEGQEPKNIQPFPEEVTEDTVEIKKLQSFPEEVTEETVPVVQAGDLNSKSLAPFPDQILEAAQPLEVALDDQLDQTEPFPDQILNETQPLEIAAEDQLDESDSAVDNPKIVPISNRPFPAISNGSGSEPLEVARAGTDEGALADEERREEILEDLHPEP